MKPLKHAALIHAWADGAEIEQFDDALGKWVSRTWYEVWHPDRIYRVKPTPKPDLTRYTCVATRGSDAFSSRQFSLDNLKLTFDGETGKLIKAEIL